MSEEKLVFKKINGELIEDANQYVKDWMANFPHSSVMIGCDSQEHSRYVKYSIVIVMHKFLDPRKKETVDSRIGHGAHVISAEILDKSKNIKNDIYSKLWAETIYTVKAAEMLDGCTKNITIHLDYNSDENEYSYSLYAAGIGYVTGLGYEAYGKPYAWAASHAADDLCKNNVRVKV